MAVYGKKRWLILFVLPVLMSVVGGCGSTNVDKPSSPDLVLISIDTLRADHLGAYGSPLGCTPFLDRIAQTGMVIRHTISVIPQTTSSHATMLTGLFPHHHGSRDNAMPIDSNVLTLPERLKQKSYHTAGYASHFLLAPEYSGLQKGFDVYHAPDVPAYLHSDNRDGKNFPLLPNEYTKADITTDSALAWLTETTEPFFLFVHYYDCHIPYRPDRPYRDMVWLRQYDRELAAVDRSAERLVRQALNICCRRRLIVHITADHGESLGEHGYRGHGRYVYFPSVEIPWIRWVSERPREKMGGIVDIRIGNAAVAPTIAADAGYIWPDTDGNALLPKTGYIYPVVNPPAYAETASRWPKEKKKRIRSLRADGYTLILGRASGIRELYDTRNDPGELKNLFDDPDYAEIKKRLTKKLFEIIHDDTKDIPNPDESLNKKVRTALKALGYLAGEPSGNDYHSEK